MKSVLTPKLYRRKRFHLNYSQVKVQLLVRKTPRKLYMKDETRYQIVTVISHDP